MSRNRQRGRNAAKKGVRAERAVARKIGGRALGGPGRIDVHSGRRRIENKHWSAPVHAGVVRQAKQRGRTGVNASGPGGFTKPAKAAAKRLGVRLSRRRAW